MDTGAGPAVISSNFMKRKNWDIDDATEILYTVANRQEDTALGIIYDVPVSIHGLTISIDIVMLVLKYTVSILRQLRLRYPEFTINQDLPNDL